MACMPSEVFATPSVAAAMASSESRCCNVFCNSTSMSSVGMAKTSEGMQAIRWFQEGKLLEIAEYCCYDVKITRLIHEYGAAHKQLHYTNRFGNKLAVPVSW